MTRKHLILTTLASAAIFALAFSAIAQAGPKGKQNEKNKATLTATSTKPQTSPQKQLDRACMIQAVEKRDTAVINAFTTYYDAMKSALQTRLDAFKAAWNNTDETARKEALKTAEQTFKSSSQNAKKSLRNSRQQAWRQFKKDRKACGATGASEDTATEGLDAQL
ncbi:MAG: hypothetical protein HYS15_00155 [Candidatus Spechtbacteria bacterium]|nr:hypothetical protein [Candidatus Spechtbacteria bacterium]